MSKVPAAGPMPRPENREEGVTSMVSGRMPWEGSPLVVTFSTEEFTSKCPVTGQPDYSSVTIRYTPTFYYLESKSLKFYLWAYREVGMHAEYIADQIATDIATAIAPQELEVTVAQRVRGGLALAAIARRG